MAGYERWLRALSMAAAAGALSCFVWLVVSGVPSGAPWPSSSPATDSANAQRLLEWARARWQAQDPMMANAAGQVLVSAYPASAAAQTLKPALGRLEQAAAARRLADKWVYQEMRSPSWGSLVQAEIHAENTADANPVANSTLILRTGSQHRFQAAFLIPAVPLSSDCSQPAGCVLTVAHATTLTQLRVRPMEGAEGWWEFANPQHVLALALGGHPLEVQSQSSGGGASMRFDVGGLDPGKMGAVSIPPAL